MGPSSRLDLGGTRGECGVKSIAVDDVCGMVSDDVTRPDAQHRR